METAILDLFSRESNMKHTSALILALTLEKVVENKQKQLLCGFFLKLQHNGATDFLGMQITYSLNTIYRFAHQHEKSSKMVAFSSIRLCGMLKRHKEIKRKMKNQLVECVQSFQEEVYQNLNRSKSLHSIIVKRYFGQRNKIAFFSRWFNATLLDRNKQLKQIQFESSQRSLTFANKKLNFFSLLINKAKKVRSYEALCEMQQSTRKNTRLQKLESVITKVMIKSRNHRYCRQNYQGICYSVINNFKRKSQNARKSELKKQKAMVILLNNQQVKQLRAFKRWCKNISKTQQAYGGLKRMITIVSQRVFQLKYVSFLKIKRKKEFHKQSQILLINKFLIENIRRPLISIAFQKLYRYSNNPYASVKSNVSSSGRQEIQAYIIFQKINNKILRHYQTFLTLIQQYHLRATQSVQADMIITQSIVQRELTQKLRSVADKLNRLKSSFLILNYLKREPLKDAFFLWKNQLRREKFQEKIKIIKQIEIQELERHDLLQKFQQLNQPSISPNNDPVHTSMDSAKLNDEYPLESIQQLEQVEDQNIYWKTRIQNQEKKKQDSRSAFEQAKKELLKKIQMAQGKYRADAFMLRSQDLYGSN